MKKIGAVILPSVAEQEAAGDRVIDPAVVDLTEWEGEQTPRPVFRDGSYRVPDDIVGDWTNPRVEDGRLVVDIEVPDILLDEIGEFRFSFAGIAGGGAARLITVHAHGEVPPSDRRIIEES